MSSWSMNFLLCNQSLYIRFGFVFSLLISVVGLGSENCVECSVQEAFLELSILTIFACRDSSIIKCGSLQHLCFGEIKAHHRSLHLLVWKGLFPPIVEAFSSYALLLAKVQRWILGWCALMVLLKENWPAKHWWCICKTKRGQILCLFQVQQLQRNLINWRYQAIREAIEIYMESRRRFGERNLMGAEEI